MAEAAWPVWAQTIAALRKAGEAGLGDTAERVFGVFGGETFKTAFKKLLGRGCGCSARKDAWNILYPYVL
jgi:hypothetical protein